MMIPCFCSVPGDSDDVPEMIALAYSVAVLYLLCIPVVSDITTEQTGCMACRKKTVS